MDIYVTEFSPKKIVLSNGEIIETEFEFDVDILESIFECPIIVKE